MPPDLPTRLARKWHSYGLMHGALIAVAKAAHELIQLRESGSHPGSGGDPAALKRLHTLQDALAHSAVKGILNESQTPR